MNKPLFAAVPHTLSEQFKLYFYAAVLRVISQVMLSYLDDERPADEATFSEHPFLAHYLSELADFGLEGINLFQAQHEWQSALQTWEEAAPQRLPLTVLARATGLNYAALTLLMAVGLIEEDARFGPLFAAFQGDGSQHRPTLALLSAWWREDDGDGPARRAVYQLQALSLIEVTNPDAPRLEGAYQPNSMVWDILRGEPFSAPASWCQVHPPESLLPLADLLLPLGLRQAVAALPTLLASGEAQTVVIRGAQGDGRRTLLGALARQMDRGLLVITGCPPPGEEANLEARWALVTPLAILLAALPVIVFDLAPGERAELPKLTGGIPLAVVMGRSGGLTGPGVERAITLVLDLPDPADRLTLWQRNLGHTADPGQLEIISQRLRLTRGNIRRAAGLARAYAGLDGRRAVTLADVQQASRALNRQALETLAQRIADPAGSLTDPWGPLAVNNETQRDLYSLGNRCRFRERLSERVGPAMLGQLNLGVRALFSGPSGTGKTLAARLLAAALQMDLYRIDLAAVVNKYIGETEKNLSQVFARAEELNVILLLDEGDALLTQRTAVQNANDRYANLETNYLLQRIESFQGILIVTTNAGDRIDSAFQRRMEVVVEFRLPEAAERWAIWQNHLPHRHAVDEHFLRDVVNRCVLSGGQIRNAVLHASLLSMNGHGEQSGGLITTGCLEEAVRREYRKLSMACPLKPSG